MSAPELRPLSQGEILDRGFKVAFRNFGRLTAIAAAVFVPVFIIGMIVVKLSLPDGAQVVDGQIFVVQESDLDSLTAGIVIAAIIAVIGYFVAFAAMHFAIGDIYLNENPSVGGSLDAARARFGQILLAILATMAGFAVPVGVAVLIGAMLGTGGIIIALLASLVYIIWFWIVSSLALPALMREDVSGAASIKRSMQLVKGHGGNVFVVLFVTGIFASIAGAIVGQIFSSVFAETLNSSLLGVGMQNFAPTVLAEMLTAPVTVAIVTVLYFDMRVRNEGYDLEMLARESGIPMGPMSATPSSGSGHPPGVSGPQLNAPQASHTADVAPPIPRELPPLPPLVDGDLPVRGPRWSQPLGPE